MREFIIECGRAPARVSDDSELNAMALRPEEPPIVVLPQVSQVAQTQAVKNDDSLTAKLHRKRGERAFFIAYDGSFVGFFEAEAETTPRQAFLRVAEELASSDKEFDLAKLELHKPVLLRGARPTKNCKLVRGKLTRLSSPGNAAEEAGEEG
jgi:hypothetical protein